MRDWFQSVCTRAVTTDRAADERLAPSRCRDVLQHHFDGRMDVSVPQGWTAVYDAA